MCAAPAHCGDTVGVRQSAPTRMVFGACVLLAATVRGGRQALVLVISVARSHQVQYNPPFLQTLREMRTAPQVEHAALYHGGPLLLTTVPLLLPRDHYC